MSTTLAVDFPLDVSGLTRPAAQAAHLTNHIARFARRDHRRLAVFAETHPRNRDLIFSCPIAALALARRHGPIRARTSALALVSDGAPLTQVLHALNLPGWTRRLPPESLHHPFPDALCVRHDDRAFAATVAPFIPGRAEPNALWLNTVAAARAMGDRSFASWVAARSRRNPTLADLRVMRLVAAYAFFTSTQKDAQACAHERAWSPNCSLGFALHEAHDWLVAQILMLQQRERARRYPHYCRHRFGEATFVLLETQHDLAEEGRLMRHCAARYAGATAAGQSFLYSVRCNQDRIATIEVKEVAEPARRHGITHAVVQSSAFGNARPHPAVTQACDAWVRHAALTKALPTAQTTTINPAEWQALFAPYCSVYGGDDSLASDAPDYAPMGFLSLLRLAAERVRSPSSCG